MRISSLFALLLLCMFSTKAWAQHGHEFRVGAGFPSLPVLDDDYHPSFSSWKYDYYKGAKRATPAINLSYNYQMNEWLFLGGTVSYSGIYQNMYDSYNDHVFARRNRHYFAVLPTARFEWFRRESVQLYSSVGVGAALDHHRERIVGVEAVKRHTDYLLAADLTPIGVSVGHDLYGFFEAGIGSFGVLRMGVGYRFNH